MDFAIFQRRIHSPRPDAWRRATPETWREVAETSQDAKDYGFAGSETPCFVGRAVAALAADPEAMRWSGRILSSWALSEAYGFEDVDGNRPHWGRYFAENFPQFANAPRTGRRWELVEVDSDGSVPQPS